MTTKKLTKLLALYLPYILLGLVATNLGEVWRLAEGKELGDKIMAMMGTFPVAFANPLPSLHPLDLLIGFSCGAGLRLAVYLRSKNAKKYRHGMEYGSARWGNAKDIEPFMSPKFADNIILTKTERLMMSNCPPDPKNTHEAIIDQETFDLAQKVRSKVRRYPDGWGDVAPLTGLLYCADCGGKMYVHRFNNGKRISQYTCSKYSKIPVGTLCKTQHRINESVVLELVKDLLKAIAEYAKHERAEFVRVVQEAQSSQQTAEVKKQRTRLATAKQRISELEVLLCKIYEDNILGKLSDSRYATLDAQYEKEQKELTAEISTLEKAISDYEKHEKDADRFIALIDKYENFDELTITMLNEFVEKILVHERDRKGSIQTTQEVEIYFNFVGRFVPPKFAEVELTPEELEEIRKREERKDRLHQNYLKRKASGWQRQYEDRTKAKKKAEMDAKKNALRAEDIAKGVFIPVSNMPKLEPKIAPQKGA